MSAGEHGKIHSKRWAETTHSFAYPVVGRQIPDVRICICLRRRFEHGIILVKSSLQSISFAMTICDLLWLLQWSFGSLRPKLINKVRKRVPWASWPLGSKKVEKESKSQELAIFTYCWEFPNLVVSNLVVAIFYTGALFCSFALFCIRPRLERRRLGTCRFWCFS